MKEKEDEKKEMKKEGVDVKEAGEESAAASLVSQVLVTVAAGVRVCTRIGLVNLLRLWKINTLLFTRNIDSASHSPFHIF